MTQITKQSYLDLQEKGQQVWHFDEQYFTDYLLVDEEFHPIITECPTYRIYEFMDGTYDSTVFPGDIPFDIFGLIVKSYISFGLRVKTLYFNPEDLTDSIIKVEYSFTKLPNETFMDEREKQISWKMSDGSWSDRIKVTIKKYTTSIQRQNEARSRRENIIEQLKSLAVDMGILERVEELFNLYATENYLYTNSGSFSLRDAIRDDTTTPWLNENLPNGYPARETIMQYVTVGTSSDV